MLHTDITLLIHPVEHKPFQEASVLLLCGMFNLHGFTENNLVQFCKIPITSSKIAHQIREQQAH